MFEFFVALACGIALGLIIYTTIFIVGSFVLMTNPKVIMWGTKIFVDRCEKITKELSKENTKEA